MAAPCGNKTSRGHACYPLTTYCPNRPATYKRDTTGRPAESAIYKPDTQPKPRPHAYAHAYTGTPARPHPRKTHCTHPRTHTTSRGPAKSQVMSEKGHQKYPKQPESHPHPLTDKQNQPNSQVVSKRGGHPTSKQPKTSRIVPPSAHNPCLSTIQAICAPQQPPAQHQTCTRTQTQVHTLKRNTYHKHTNTTRHIPSTTRRTPRTPEKRCHRPAAALG